MDSRQAAGAHLTRNEHRKQPAAAATVYQSPRLNYWHSTVIDNQSHSADMDTL